MKPLLTVEITEDELGFTLYCPELNIHACGKNESEVRHKFVDAIFDYWRFLETHDFKDESPYKEHLALLTNEVLPALASISLRSPHRPQSFTDRIIELFSQRGEAWDADIFGNLVKSAVA